MRGSSALTRSLYGFLRRVRLADPPVQSIIRREKPSLVHAHFGLDAALVELACRRTHTPLIVSFYGFDSAGPQTARGKGLEVGLRRVFASSRLIVVEGPSIAQRLAAEWCCPKAKIRILRIAIPVRAIRCLPECRRGPGPVRLLHCGRFVPKKGLAVLLSALRILRSEGADFELRVVGDGPERERIEHLIRVEGLASFVTVCGSQARRFFWDELERCDLLVAPSLTALDGDTEGGAPTVLLEAQAAGVPVVTTDHADIPFVVRPDESAFVARENDVESLAATLRRAMNASERWAEMGKRGRQFMEEHHSHSAVGRQLEAIYDEAIA